MWGGGVCTVFAVFQNSTGFFTVLQAPELLRGTIPPNTCPALLDGVHNLDKTFTALG